MGRDNAAGLCPSPQDGPVSRRAASVWERHTPRLQVYKACPGDVALIVGLVEEHVLAVATAVRRKVLQDAVIIDAVLQTELLPELGSHLAQEAREGAVFGQVISEPKGPGIWITARSKPSSAAVPDCRTALLGA